MANQFKFDKPKDSLNNLFGAPKDQITREISIEELNEITDQPFNAYSDEALEILVEDIRENGLLSPLVVAPIDGGYEIIAGRNRYRACKILGMEKLPCIIRNNLSAAKRNLILVASNLMQRQKLLPSEKAKAYKMHKDACDVLKIKFKPDLLESSANVYKYLRLNNLNHELMDMLDCDELTFSLCYEIAGLKAITQQAIYEYIQSGKNVTIGGLSELKDYEKNDADITAQLIELCEAIKPTANEIESFKQNFDKNNGTIDFKAQNSALESDFALSRQTNRYEDNYAYNANKDVLSDVQENDLSTKTHSDVDKIPDNASAAAQTVETYYAASTSVNNEEYNPESKFKYDEANRVKISHAEISDETIFGDSKDSAKAQENIAIREDDFIIIQRTELPWTLRNNCDMEKLKSFIIGKLPKLSQEYFDLNPMN